MYRIALLLALCAASGCAFDARGSGPETVARLGDSAEVEAPEAMRACVVDADCILVASGCDGCCQRLAIRADAEEAYREGFIRACASYVGGICDCMPAALEARCEARRCVAMVTWTDLEPAGGRR